MKKIVWRMCLIGVLVASLFSVTAPSGQGPTALAQSISDVEAHTLENGLRVLLVSQEDAPVTIFNVWVGVGSVNETRDTAGISHFFEHMVFKGTDTRPGTVDVEIENLGGSTNASTSFDWTQYYITVPSENGPAALEILADITLNANFPEPEILREKDVVLREMDQRQDSPTNFLYFKLYEEWFDEHPYGLPIIGYPESLESLTRDDFLAFVDRYYVPNNMVLIVAGAFEQDTMLAQIEDLFGDVPAQELPGEDFTPEPPLTESEVVEYVRDFNQGYLIYGWPAPAVDDVEDVYAMDLLLAVLSMGRGSRFYRNIFRDQGLVSEIDAGYFTLVDESTFNVYAAFPYANRAAVEEAILDELSRILEGDVTEVELDRAKTMLVSQFVLGNESVAGLAGTLGFYATVAGDYTFAQTYPDGIRSVSVTDLVETAQRYIDLDTYLQLVIVPEDYQPTEPVALQPEGNTLDNGLKLILREDHTSGVVGIQTFVGTGTATAPMGKAGLAAMTQRLLLKGTEDRSEDELFEELENLGAQLGQDILADMGHISLVATGETLDRALPLYLEVLTEPAFTQEAFDQVQQEMLREIQAQRDDNFALIYDNFLAELYGDSGYAYSGIGTEDSIRSITLEDVVAFYETYYVPDNMVVAAVGDFDAQDLYAGLADRLGTLSPSEGDLVSPSVQIDLQEDRTVIADRNSNLSWLILGFPGPAVRDDAYAAMKVLNAVVGGGFSSKLFQQVRAEQGLAYSTGAFFPSRDQESHLVTYAIALPENAEAVQASILQILAEIKEIGVSQEELERAINYVIGQFAIDHETAVRRAWYLGWYEMLGVGVAYDDLYPEQVRGVTVSDLQQAAQTYLDNYIVSVLGPADSQ